MQIGFRLGVFTLGLFCLASQQGWTADAKPEDNPQRKFVSMVIWGTDDGKPDDKNLHDVDKDLKEKFGKVFKWKNYYRVGEKKTVVLKPGDRKNLEMSEKCLLKFQWNQNAELKIDLIGEGKRVETRTFTMPLSDILVLGGGDRNATAWFVVIKQE